MLYERKPEKAADERESSSVVQRYQIEKSEYGKEAEAFRNRPIPKVNFDFMKLHSVPIAGPAIQPKLTIGEPNDKYEQEADRVAAEVVQEINRPAPVSMAQGEVVQGQEKKEEDELNLKPMVQSREALGGGEASRELESAINRARGGGQPLDAALQQSMGQEMGADFSLVRVHTDAQADQLNQSLQAKAFTTGQDVFFRQGTYQPGSRGGQELIAHELTHVVQQEGVWEQRSPQPQSQLLHHHGREKETQAQVGGVAFGGKRGRWGTDGNAPRGVIRRYDQCSESNHETDILHRWVQRLYKATWEGGKKEYSYKRDINTSWNFVDIADTDTYEVYEIKVDRPGSRDEAEAQARRYADDLNECECEGEGEKWHIGGYEDTDWTEEGFGIQVTASVLGNGVIALYINEITLPQEEETEEESSGSEMEIEEEAYPESE